MSVSLIPLAQKDLDPDEIETVDLSNGTLEVFSVISQMAGKKFKWDGTHDEQVIDPDSLQEIARRLENLAELFPDTLRWLAEQGGAVVS